jgi:hypothetical protein
MKKARTPPATAKEAGTKFATAAPEEVAAAAVPETEEAASEAEVPVAFAPPAFAEPEAVLIAELELALLVLVSACTPGHPKIQARIALLSSDPAIISLGKPL